MKKLNFIIAVILTSIICTSCDWLEPEEDPSTQIYRTAATLIHDPETGKEIFVTDDGVQLIPTTALSIPDTLENTLLDQRYYISFQIEIQTPSTKLYNITLISMQMMSKEPIISISNNNTINEYKNEQLKINLLWCSGNYLNVITQIKGSGNVAHNYHLLHNPHITSDTLYLTMRYDDNDDQQIYDLQQAMYYDLSEYLTSTSDSTTICFHYNSGSPKLDTLYLKIANK